MLFCAIPSREKPFLNREKSRHVLCCIAESVIGVGVINVTNLSEGEVPRDYKTSWKM